MKNLILPLLLLPTLLTSGCTTSEATNPKTNTASTQSNDITNYTFNLDLNSLSYRLPSHTKICTPKSRNNCSSGDCVKDEPAVFVLYDEKTNQVCRCDNNPCDCREMKVDNSGLYKNMTPLLYPDGSMYKFSNDGNYVEIVSLGMDLIIYEGSCQDVK